MKAKQFSGKAMSISMVLILLALCLLAGLGVYGYHQSTLTDIGSSEALTALIADTTGHAEAQVQAVKSEGNLAVVSYSADNRQGILLFERTNGQDDSRCRLLDWTESGEGLHTYETSLNGVVHLTVLYGENTEEAKTVTLLSGDDSASYTLTQGSVLELRMDPGVSSGSETELLYCGG